jgi:hypothetical protein
VRGMTKLDATLLFLGISVMSQWDLLEEGEAITIRKVNGEPKSEALIVNAIKEIESLDGELNREL